MKKGQAVLSIVFVIGGILVLVGITVALLVIAFLNTSFGFQASNRALALGIGGVHDAIIQLVRDKDFSDTLGYCVPAAGLPCPQDHATVTVTQNVPRAGEATIVSEGRASRRRRKVEAVVSVSTSTGVVDVLSWRVITL